MTETERGGGAIKIIMMTEDMTEEEAEMTMTEEVLVEMGMTEEEVAEATMKVVREKDPEADTLMDLNTEDTELVFHLTKVTYSFVLKKGKIIPTSYSVHSESSELHFSSFVL